LLPGWQALLATGQVAALAALHGLELRRTRERPVHMEVSAQEAVAMVGALPECAHAIYACPGRAGSGRYVAPSGLFPCRDGQVRIIAPDNHQWAGMVRAMGEPDWTRGLEKREARAEHAAHINREIAAWTSQRDIAQCAAELQAEGVPATPMNGPDELLASPQFEARGFMRSVRLGGVDTRVPGLPYTWSPTGASTRPPAAREGIGGLRVAEFAHVFAGPIAGSLLGAMGAQVVRFEDTARLDLYRRTGPFAGGVAGPERGAYFTVANHSKHSLAVDPGEQPGVAAALAAHSDVVLESFGTRRVTRLAVDAGRLLANRPELLYLSVSGFGQSGPLETYRAYANNVHAYGGFSHLTRGTDGELVHIGTVLADPLAALTAATVIAAWALGSERPGGVVDLSMAEVVASKLGEFIAEAAAGEARTVPVGCDRFPYAPHGIHPCAHGRWLAIAVQSDTEWDALLDVLGRPEALADPAWSTAAARWEARRAIESALDNITREQEAEMLFHRLQRGGVRACPVWPGGELIDNPHLRARDFFPRIEHPDPDIPEPRLIGLAWRVAGEGPWPLRPPPRLGEYQLGEEPA
jgi:crotonobetainyl-CoA:carnitine CoA-transferase CaiB-like acyl-CoA transferase